MNNTRKDQDENFGLHAQKAAAILSESWSPVLTRTRDKTCFASVTTPTRANSGSICLKISQHTYFGQRNRGKISAKLSDQLDKFFKVHEVLERAFFDKFRLCRPIRPMKLGGMRQMRPYLESSHQDESNGISMSSIRQSIDAKTLV